ncbi:MAG: VWA domain-containing protein [Alphaproteobacteria bacterium]
MADDRKTDRRSPPTTASDTAPDTTPAPTGAGAVADFLAQVAALDDRSTGGVRARRGRLIFALDATASRQPTWDSACHIQAEMFEATAALGGLDVQLVYYRGFRQIRASRWIASARALTDLMLQVQCQAGHTQIGRLLRHVHKQARTAPVDAVVFVGDACEEDIDQVADAAGRLGLLGVPVFIFHEGNDPAAGRVFAEIARLTRGACCHFDRASAGQLRALLGAVAAYAAGGRPALARYGEREGQVVRLIASQLGADGPAD